MAAEVYYQAAKKRIGVLGSSLFDIQCLFFACVFEKYALRPVEAWFYIQMACTRLEAMLLRNPPQGRNGTTTGGEGINSSARLLEQRVFWTCVKAERFVVPALALIGVLRRLHLWHFTVEI